jgi:hypothetical protein
MDNNKHQIIFQAYRTKDNKIVFERNSNHIPTLDYIANQLFYDIMELRAIQKTKQDIKDKPLIQNVSDFLKRGRKR